MTLLDLADRCEQATGPDRELALRILCAVDPEHWTMGCNPERHDPTASLDVAMTLVPEGWVGLLGIPANGGCKLQPEDEPQNAIETRAATPALALCAAALKARAHA